VSYAGKTISYNLTSGTAGTSDFTGSATGTVTLDALSKAYVSVPVIADATTEGSETIVLSSGGASASVTVADTSLTPAAATYTLTAASSSVAEGGQALFTLATTGLAAGSKVSYTVTGTGNSASLSSAGTAEIDSGGTAVISLNAPTNSTIGDSGKITVALTNGKGSGSINVSDASATSFSAAAIATLNSAGSPLSLTVDGTSAQSINVLTSQVAVTNGIVVSSPSAAITLTTGDLADTVTIVGSANNNVITGAGNDVVTITGSGNNTISVGAGSDKVTAGTGNDTIRIGSGNLTAADTIDAGDGTDTLIISGTGNVINATNVVGVENLVLDGTEVSITSDAAAKLSKIEGSAATSEITFALPTGAASAELDLSKLNLSAFKKLVIPASMTVTMSAEQIQKITTFTNSGTILADAAGAALLATKGVANVSVDAGAFTLVQATAAGVAAKGSSYKAAVSASVSDAYDQLYLDGIAADQLQFAGSTLTITGTATVAQAEKIIDNLAGIANLSAPIAVADTPANIAATLNATAGATYGDLVTGNDWLSSSKVSSLTLTSAATVAQADKIFATTGDLAAAVTDAATSTTDKKVITTPTYTISDTASAVAAGLGTAATKAIITGASSVALTDAATVTEATTLRNDLGSKLAGYDLTGSASTLFTAASAVVDGATKITVTGNATVGEASKIDSYKNTGTTSYAIADTAANIATASSALLSGATSVTL